MRKTILVTLIAALMLVTGGASAQAAMLVTGGASAQAAMLVTGGASAQAATAICDGEPCANTVTEQFAVLSADIPANVPVRYQPAFLGLANTALRFQPGEPITPSDPLNFRRFRASAAVVRALWEANRSLAGRAGYSCASATIIRTDLAALRPYYTTGTISLLNFTLFQPGEPVSPACATG